MFNIREIINLIAEIINLIAEIIIYIFEIITNRVNTNNTTNNANTWNTTNRVNTNNTTNNANTWNRVSIFSNSLDKTASYIFSRDQKGVYHFALCRKVPQGARLRTSGPNTGAAGTRKKYHGKWGSFGGGVDVKSKNLLHAAISEINDEASLNFISRNVDITWSNSRKNSRLKLWSAVNVNGVAVFIFEISDYQEFIKHFPKFPRTRGGSNIVTSSKGEIDLVASFTTDELKKYQNNSNQNNSNNFVISYVAQTFNDVVIPYISDKKSSTFKKKHYNNGLNFIKDKKERRVKNTPIYYESSRGIYK